MRMGRVSAPLAWAAIRHRRFQAGALVLLSALLTTVAVFGPLYARAMEHAVFLDALDRASVIQSGIVVSQISGRIVTPDPADAEKAVPSDIRSVFAAPTVISEARASLTMSRKAGGASADTTVYAPGRGCAQLVITAGRCVVARDEVMVSTDEARFEGWRVGERIEVVPNTVTDKKPPEPVLIVGTFDQVRDDAYWFGVRLTGRAGKVAPVGLGVVPLVDPPIVAPTFFRENPERVTITSTFVLRRDAVDVDRLTGLVASVQSARNRVLSEPSEPRLTSGLAEIGAEVFSGQKQAALLVPLLIGQLAVLALVILGLGTSAAVEQRRPEIALARLRGSGLRDARRILFAELATLVAVGVPIGFLVALPLTVWSAHLWLPAGVPLEVHWPTYAAAALALLAGIGALLLTSRVALREPIPSLLRRVPPRQHGWAVGLLDVAIITIAIAGVVTIMGGNLSGPLAIATPALLALAVGMLLALIVVPVTSAFGRATLRRGHVASGLTALQIARRPAVRRVVAIVTVTSALLVFATDAYLVASRNREARAALEAGSEFVLRTDAKSPKQLREVLRAVDPTGKVVAPVAFIQRPNPGSLSTMAVVPAFMAGGAGPTSRTPVPWSRIETRPAPPILLDGDRVNLVINQVRVPIILHASPNPSANPVPPPDTPLPDSVPVKIELRNGQGEPYSVPAGRMSLHPKGAQTLGAAVYCTQACTFTGLSIYRDPDETRTIAGSFRVVRVTVDEQPPLNLTSARWSADGKPVPESSVAAGDADFAQAVPNAATSFTTRFNSATRTVTVSASQPALPAVVVPPAPTSTRVDLTTVASFAGFDLPAKNVGQVPVAPGDHKNVAVVDYDAVAVGAVKCCTTGSLEVWVAHDQLMPRVRTALTQARVTVTSETSRAALRMGFDASASAWALRLGIVVGIAALLLTTLVLILVTVTSWRTRADDYAALRLAGMRKSTTTRVGLGEQLAVIGLAVPVGAVCGFFGSRLSLGLIPLFTDPSPTFAVDLHPAYGPMTIVAVGVLLYFSIVAAALGWGLTRRGAVSRVKDQR